MTEPAGGERVADDPALEGSGEAEVVLGLVAAPGATAGLGVALAADLADELGTRLPGARWRVELVEDALVRPPATDGEIVDATRRELLARGWDVAVCLTDVPLEVARRPVIAHASPLHGVGVVSVPALGAVGVQRRLRSATLRLIDTLLGEEEVPAARAPGRRHHRLRVRVRQLGLDADTDAENLRFTTQVLTGHLRLLAGMVRANRPWRLAAGLSRALAGAGAAGVFALVTSDIWKLSDAFGWPRLLAVAVGSVATIAVTLVVGAGLWERPRHRRMRQQAVLFNLATTATVTIGVLAFYLALYVLSLLAALLLVPSGLLASALGHPVTFADHAGLAWLVSSLATVGGSLGAGLETDEAVRAAAYTRRAADSVVDPGDPGG